VLGGCGAWPAAGQACSGYLVAADGYRLLIDPGYATLPRLLELCTAAEVDCVVVSHGHPDHCVDLNPLLRPARSTTSRPAPCRSSLRPGRWTPSSHWTGPACWRARTSCTSSSRVAASSPDRSKWTVGCCHTSSPTPVCGCRPAVLSSQWAHRAGVGRLLLTHQWPGVDRAAGVEVAREEYGGPVAVAAAGSVTDILR